MLFDVTVTRCSYSTKTITVDADDRKSAEDLALEKAFNQSFDTEHSAAYHIDGIKESDAYVPTDDLE